MKSCGVSRFLIKAEKGSRSAGILVADKQSGAKVCTCAPPDHHLQAMMDANN
jgi:hypothetical protein